MTGIASFTTFQNQSELSADTAIIPTSVFRTYSKAVLIRNGVQNKTKPITIVQLSNRAAAKKLIRRMEKNSMRKGIRFVIYQ